MNFKKLALAIVCAGGAMAASVPAQAANWLMLQGTERDSAAGRAKVWGFIQPTAQYIKGTTVQAGQWGGQTFQANTLGPDRSSEYDMNIRRARIGVRGQGFPLDGKTNYFILAEYGHNAITVPGGGGGAMYLTDASVTLNHVPGARFRVGQFKTPGSEEGLQAIHVFDYINFTSVTDGMLFETFVDGDGTDASAVNKPNGARGAFRDIGAQVFDTFKFGAWEASYAVMVGNGNGINRQDNDNQKEFYGYVSAEQVYGGKGPRIQTWKTFAWGQMGKRTIAGGQHDRSRYGVGTTFRKGKIRAAAEYMMGSGVIINGTDGGGTIGAQNNAGTSTADINVELDGEASGYYAHIGYQVMKKVEIDFRWDQYNRSTHAAAKERTFQNATVGVQYFINKKTRIVANYQHRMMSVTNPSAIAVEAQRTAAEKIADGVDPIIGLQLLAIF